jgi:2-hydroxychromene-2-carboxylate isomerase
LAALRTDRPALQVTVFSDYICPFCYIGERRLARLGEHYDLRVDHRFFEIRPDTPSSGIPLSELGYPPDRWRQMMAHLARMADEENISLAEREITTNSHKALLLAEAAKEEGTEVFCTLNEKLFATFFGEGRNIGDESVLRGLAEDAGVSPDIVSRASGTGSSWAQSPRKRSWRRPGKPPLRPPNDRKLRLAGGFPSATLATFARSLPVPLAISGISLHRPLRGTPRIAPSSRCQASPSRRRGVK